MATDVNYLSEGDLTLIGQLTVASNATLYVHVGRDQVPAVYKPIAGEQPLWDFPDHTLAFREVAAYELSELLGWGIVPPTVLRDGPFGLGAVQEWIEVDDEVDLVAFAQSEDPRLAKIALFDAVVNNTDRKISHLLPTEKQVFGCDHGVTFHVDDKLRTVLWQWRGQQIPQEWLSDLSRLRSLDLRALLGHLLAQAEILALELRIDRLVEGKTYPMPSQDWPAVPWPPF